MAKIKPCLKSKKIGFLHSLGKRRSMLKVVLFVMIGLFGGGIFFSFSLANGSANVDTSIKVTPEKCFRFSNGTITKYKKGAYPECGTDVIIPAKISGISVRTIGRQAFYANKLTSVKLPDGVKEIGAWAFAYNKLTSVKLPDGVKEIGGGAFSANKLTSVKLPDGVKEIGGGAFSANKLTSVKLPDGVKEIGDRAFAYNQLTSVNIPDGVKEIGDGVFAYNQLTSVNIPNGVTTIGGDAFAGNKLISVSIPDGVKKIGNYAFAENKLTSVKIPNSVASIGQGAFRGNLKSPLPAYGEENIKNIAGFDNADLVFTIPSTPEKCFEFSNGTITKYKKGAYPECGANVIIPSTIKSSNVLKIGENSFKKMGLNSVIFPSSVTEIGPDAFSYNNLKKVKIPGNIKKVGYWAFKVNQLENLILENGINSIGYSAFYNNKLIDISIPESVNDIQAGAFNRNQLPDSQAFVYARTSNGSEDISKVVSYGGKRRANIVIPNNVRTLGAYSFYADGISSIVLPRGLQKIENDAFNLNSLTNIEIPESVDFIGKNAFMRNTKLFSIQLNSPTIKIQKCAFGCDQVSNNISTYPFTIRRKGGLEGLNLASEDTHLIVNPLTLKIHFQDEKENKLIESQTLVGPHKQNFKGWTSITANQWFEAGKSYKILPAVLSNYSSSSAKSITFPVSPTPENNTLEITFKYRKKDLVLHYSFDDENYLWKDTSGKENDAHIYGNPKREDWGKVNGALSFNGTKNQYTIKGDSGIYNAGNAGLRLVPDDYDPEKEEANIFCSYPLLKKLYSNISFKECNALLDLYRETKGKDWKANNGWNIAVQIGAKYELHKQAFDICKWSGIVCESGKIVGFHLGNNNLKGTIPESFKNFVHLRKLDLHDNQLSNSLSNINNQSLKDLDLSNNPLDETIPTDFFSKNTALRAVNLANTHLNGVIPASLSHLDQLETLKLDHNYLVEPFPSSLKEKQFPELQEFDISFNYIKDAIPQYSQVYLGFQDNNSAILLKLKKNTQQYRLYLVDRLGQQNAQQIKGDEAVSVMLKKQLYANGTWINKQITESEVENNFQDSLVIVHKNFPDYTVKLSPNSVSGILGFKVKGTNNGELSHTMFRLSQGEGENQEQNTSSHNQWESNLYSGEKSGSGLNFELGAKYLDEYFSTVHFNVGGNDFGGGFFWLPVEKLENPVSVGTNGKNGIERKVCSNRVRGFYYNSQRGERLWPLDQESKEALQKFSPNTYANLELKGGWYTSCVGEIEGQKEDPYGVYGAIQHTYKGETFQLNAGIAYDTTKNQMKADGLKCNFQRLNNSYPFGYIYDDHGHIGFVGSSIKPNHMGTDKVNVFHNSLNDKLNEGLCINEIFDYNGHELGYTSDPDKQIDGFDDWNSIVDFIQGSIGTAKTTLFNLGIKGIIGFTSEFSSEEKKQFEGNALDSALLLRTDTTISNMFNVANKNAEKLCRGKWRYLSEFMSMNGENLYCFDGGEQIHSISTDAIQGKTIIVRNGNLKLSGYLRPGYNQEPLNIFIDRGNLILDASDNGTGNLSAFDSLGYLERDQNCTKCAKANYLKGNFIVNGLILSKDNTSLMPIKNKLYVHGKMISFNTYREPTQKRIDTIMSILGDNRNDSYKNYISFDRMFSRACNASGIGSDGTRCSGISKKERKEKGHYSSLLVDKSFGLIDMHFPSLLFR